MFLEDPGKFTGYVRKWTVHKAMRSIDNSGISLLTFTSTTILVQIEELVICSKVADLISLPFLPFLKVNKMAKRSSKAHKRTIKGLVYTHYNSDITV